MKSVAGRLIAGLFFLLPCFAQAGQWDIYYPDSKLWFEGSQAGTAFTGKFSAYQATVNFDPKHPENANVEVNIDMRSAKIGDKDKDDALPGKEWFDVNTFPFAQLYAGKIRKLGEHKFELSGLLTIKDLTHPVTMPFTMEDERDAQRIKGEVTINRTDYNIGTGTWANEAYVKFPVKIGIDLLAKERN